MESALKQVGALMEALGSIIGLDERILLENYLIDPEQDIPWPSGESDRLFERIMEFVHTDRFPEPPLRDLSDYSQEKLSRFMIKTVDMPEKRRRFLFSIAVAIHYHHFMCSKWVS